MKPEEERFEVRQKVEKRKSVPLQEQEVKKNIE